MWKQTVSSVSEHIFPGIAVGVTLSKTRDVPHIDALRSKITASLPLQMALFFNVVFFPVWFVTVIVMLPLKYENLPELNKIILIIALTSAVLIEIARLYMGYYGNLNENIPELAGFWMLSLLLQAPMQTLLLHPALRPSPVERVTQAVMCALLAAQLIAGFSALRAVAKRSSDVFYLSQFFTERDNRRTVNRY